MSTTRLDIKPVTSRAESPQRGANEVEHRKATATWKVGFKILRTGDKL